MIDDNTKATLLSVLKAEEDDALGYLESELKAQQSQALRDYFGEEYGDEEEGRSRIVTREVFETIEWIRPDLKRAFASGGRIVELDPNTPQDDQYTQTAADYLNWCFFNDNDGLRVLDSFIFDGLLHRRGFIGAYWKEEEYDAPYAVSGLTLQQADELLNDPMTQIEGVEQKPIEPSEAHPDGIAYTVRMRKKVKDARVEFCSIAPEDINVNSRCVDLDDARYVRREHRQMVGEAMKRWPEHAEYIEAYGKRDVSPFRSEEVRADRFRDDDAVGVDWTSASVGQAAEITIFEEYIRFDADEDDYPELLRVYRLADYILEVEEVDANPFASWTPIPIAHRFYGLSVHDIVKDVQRTMTVLERASLDSVYQSVAPRIYARDGVNLDDLLSVRPGGIIRGTAAPGDAIMPLAVPDLSASALQMMEYKQQALEKRTGVSRQSQGMDPDALNKTATGIQLLQSSAGIRKEEIARNLANGLEQLFRKAYRLICRNQNAPRMVKATGKWTPVDPRGWNCDLKVRVHVGLGTGAREAQLAMLQMIQAQQAQWWQLYQDKTPVLKLQHMYATVEEMCRIMGYRSPEPFFSEPPEGFELPPQQDPNAAAAQADMMKVQAEMQARAAELQMKEREIVLQHQKDIELSQQQQADDMVRAEVDARHKAEQLAMQEREAQRKYELEMARLEFEREKAAAEIQLRLAELGLKERDTGLRESELGIRATETDAKIGIEHEKMRAAAEKDASEKALNEGVVKKFEQNAARVEKAASVVVQMAQEMAKPKRTVRQIVRGPDGRAEAVDEIDADTGEARRKRVIRGPDGRVEGLED